MTNTDRMKIEHFHCMAKKKRCLCLKQSKSEIENASNWKMAVHRRALLKYRLTLSFPCNLKNTPPQFSQLIWIQKESNIGLTFVGSQFGGAYSGHSPFC